MSASTDQSVEVIPVDLRSALEDPEKAFVDRYAQLNFQNATEAYHQIRPDLCRRSANKIAHQILARPRVRRYVDSLLLPAPEKIRSAKDKLISQAARITDKAEAANEFGPALKGIEQQAKLQGLYSQEDSDQAQYMQFFDKVSIVVNQQPQVQQQPDVKVIEGQCE